MLIDGLPVVKPPDVVRLGLHLEGVTDAAARSATAPVESNGYGPEQVAEEVELGGSCAQARC